MKRLLLIIILTLSFQTLIRADDIRDFQIEGMSIGDSLLDFYSKEEILDSPKANRYKDKTYTTATFFQINSDKLSTYESITVSYKLNDNEYLIVGQGGVLGFKNNHSKCYKKKDTIVKEIKMLFPDNKVIDLTKKISGSTDGSITKQSYIKLNNGFIGVQCKKFGKEFKKKYNEFDHLKVDMFNKKFNYWLINIAFK
mgnify:CR=1 FL=1